MLALAISGSQLCKQLRDLCVEPVAVVVEQLRMNETIFLHPKGVDIECDEARESIDSRVQ